MPTHAQCLWPPVACQPVTNLDTTQKLAQRVDLFRHKIAAVPFAQPRGVSSPTHTLESEWMSSLQFPPSLVPDLFVMSCQLLSLSNKLCLTAESDFAHKYNISKVKFSHSFRMV